jgi:hypothetical protein
MCRSLPPTMQFSVSPLEKTDAQIHYVSGRVVPTAGTDGLNASDNLRPGADAQDCEIIGHLRSFALVSN